MLSFLSVLTVAVLNAGGLCLVARGSRANSNNVQSISTLVPHTRHISGGSDLSGDGRPASCSSASMSRKRILKVGLPGQEDANASHKRCQKAEVNSIASTTDLNLNQRIICRPSVPGFHTTTAGPLTSSIYSALHTRE